MKKFFSIRADLILVMTRVLSDFELGEVFCKLADYVEKGEVPEKDKMTAAAYLAFQFLKLEIDLDNGEEALEDENKGYLD